MNPNVEMIRSRGMRIIRGHVPAEIRKELNAAVKIKELGHLKKNGMLPEIYFHPDQLHTAREIQKKEALYAIECLKKVIVRPFE